MKKAKNSNRPIINLSIGIAIFLCLPSCEKESDINFAETQVNFEVDSIYKTTNDGFLYVDMATRSGGFTTYIYAGKNVESLSQVAILKGVGGSATLPLEKNTYWKVSYLDDEEYIIDLNIRWTPFE